MSEVEGDAKLLEGAEVLALFDSFAVFACVDDTASKLNVSEEQVQERVELELRGNGVKIGSAKKPPKGERFGILSVYVTCLEEQEEGLWVASYRLEVDDFVSVAADTFCRATLWSTGGIAFAGAGVARNAILSAVDEYCASFCAAYLNARDERGA